MIKIGSPRFNMRLNYLLHPLKLNDAHLYYTDDSNENARYYFHYTGQLNGPFGKAHSLLCLAFISKYLPLDDNEVIEIQIEKFVSHPHQTQFKRNHPVVFLFTLLFEGQYQIKHNSSGLDILFEELLIIDRQFALRHRVHYFLNDLVEHSYEETDPFPHFEKFITAISKDNADEITDNPFLKKLIGFIELNEFLDRIYLFLTTKVNNPLFKDCVLNIYRVELSKIRYGIKIINRYYDILDQIVEHNRTEEKEARHSDIEFRHWYQESKTVISSSRQRCEALLAERTDTFISKLLRPIDTYKSGKSRSLIISEETAFFE